MLFNWNHNKFSSQYEDFGIALFWILLLAVCFNTVANPLSMLFKVDIYIRIYLTFTIVLRFPLSLIFLFIKGCRCLKDIAFNNNAAFAQVSSKFIIYQFGSCLWVKVKLKFLS